MASGDTSLFDDVKKVLTNEDFCDIKPLGRGAFGEVLSAVSPNKEHVAVKIIKNKDAWHIEERVWPVLRHRNVLPLLKVINVDSMNLNLYVMPKIPYVLNKVLRSKRFLADNNGLVKVKQWSLDTLSGLQYLHKKGWAHTDIKTDNILIASDSRALLCDFSGLTHTGEQLKRLCAPLVYRPPEYYDPARHEHLEGGACDVWLFGMMCLNVLTGNWPRHMMKPVIDARSWKTNVEPVVLQALKKTPFCVLMKRAFPAVSVTEDELHLAHEFVVSMMKWNQNDRPAIHKIKSHPFLSTLKSYKYHCKKYDDDGSIFPALQESSEGKNNVTKPFLKECMSSQAKNEKVTRQLPDVAENIDMVVKDNASPELQRPNDVLADREAGKNIPGRIKDWFKKKWNKTFQRPNKYIKLEEESE